MSGALDVLQMKKEEILKVLAAGTHLGGSNLDFQIEQYICRRKSKGKSEENLGEAVACQLRLLLLLRTLQMAASSPETMAR